MSRWRYVAGVGLIVLLGAVVWWAATTDRFAGPAVPTTTVTSTTALAAVSTTTSTTVPETTSTTTEVQRIAEVEEILRDLWFGWFDAIYRKDADALWEVVATEVQHDAGVAAMEKLQFTAPPSREGIPLEVDEILMQRPDCLVAYVRSDVTSFLQSDVPIEHVEVLWADQDGWRFATFWQYRNDLWQQDCDLVRETTP